jgi:D-serine deaminase-like pyridoxal phosphate-dependent protein
MRRFRGADRSQVLVAAQIATAWRWNARVGTRCLSIVRLDRPTRVLLRSGCYAFHDVGHYARLVARLEGRLPMAWRAPGGFQPAIEIWGRLVSRPVPGVALLIAARSPRRHALYMNP